MKSRRKVWIFCGIMIFILLLNHIFGWSAILGDADNLKFLKNIVQDNLLYAVIIYIVLTIAGCIFLALPGVTFAILAGVLFGPVLGTICCSVASTLGAVCAFLAGRFFLKESVKPMVMGNKYIRKWLFDEFGKNQLFVLMITRLVPVFPYNLQNFAYGITDIRLGTYTIGSLFFMLPGTAMYTFGTAGLVNPENRMLYFIIAIGLAVVVAVIGFFLKRRFIGEENGDA